MTHLQNVKASFDNAELGMLAAKISRAILQGKDDSVVEFHRSKMKQFITENWETLSVNDRINGDAHGEKVNYPVWQGDKPRCPVSTSLFGQEFDFERAILNRQDAIDDRY